MLELSKKILTKVSFDKRLFQKELLKALTWISDGNEARAFKIWCIKEFGDIYPKIITKAFSIH